MHRSRQTKNLPSEDGYELWLRYPVLSDAVRRTEYLEAIGEVAVVGSSATLEVAREELERGLSGLLDDEVSLTSSVTDNARLLVGTFQTLSDIADLDLEALSTEVATEGFCIKQLGDKLLIAGHSEAGLLYGVFALLRLMQTEGPLRGVHIVENPRLKYRVLNHWDNLDRTVERGYAGFSLWDWHLLPDYLSPRYKDYARAVASVGLNCTVLTNVNSNALVITPEFLEKVAALAGVFRPYGIKVFLSARFSAPIELDKLETADPRDPRVQDWWKRKVREIYSYIPDFGGFIVKANSEGQPGPQDYNRDQAEGANLLADALAPHGGVVIWRAFIYDDKEPDDRHKQAYNELLPLDGKFHDNAFVQAKNGAIDFQPREPFHPLFGALKQTPLMLEFQLTQEYLGCATHWVYLAPLFKETLGADTYCKGQGSTVAKVIDGSVYGQTQTGMAAVTNIGNERNWCGHPMAAANWYAFGRLSWDHELTAAEIAEEWLRMTFSNESAFLQRILPVMMDSREVCVNYMTPLGLHHIMARDHHYGPGPWVTGGRADWTSVYYHRADKQGIGFDRTPTGTNATSQYFPEVAERFADRRSCPENLLLWFHRVGWNEKLCSGRTLWNELCYRYHEGANAVVGMQQAWVSVESYVDSARFTHVRDLLNIQAKEAKWWRDACLSYFQTFSGRDIPKELEQPEHSLEHYMATEHHYVPGI